VVLRIATDLRPKKAYSPQDKYESFSFLLVLASALAFIYDTLPFVTGNTY
jgi:hypothetical protein